MPLTLSELQDIQADAMADDVDIDLEKMSLWTAEQAVEYFESGGAAIPPPPKPDHTAQFTCGSVPTGSTPWLSCLEKKPSAKYRLVAFGWTGNRGGQGSAHNLRRAPFNWSKEAGDDCEVYEVSLPGRGTRMKEPLAKSTPELVAALCGALSGALNGGLPYAFVGFSFGAVLAWEVSQAISASSPGEGPALLCAVSAEGPSWSGRAGALHASSDAEFERVLREKGGTDFILKDDGMKKMYLPVIRADLCLEETYEPPTGRYVGVRTLAVHGAKPGRDKEATKVGAAEAGLWVDASSAAGSRAICLDGCDWYVLQDGDGVRAVLREVAGSMAAALA